MPRLRLRGRAGTQRRTARAAALGIAMLLCGGLFAPSALAAAPTPPTTVAAKLGASQIPAEIVILVDISGSMTSDGLYPKVLQALPGFLASLKQQDPQDVVAVVPFGAPSDTQTVYLGPPDGGAVPLPPMATSDATDFGYAFQKALGILSQAPARIKVGGVLLMSDGELDAPGDQQYSTYSAPGWAKLRTMAQGLGISVTGYGLPLTANQLYTQSVNEALAHVFAQRQTLTDNPGDIGAQLNLAGQQIMDSRVAAAAQPDSDRGVQVIWTRRPGQAGVAAMNLATGHADAEVRLTSTASRIPLTVSGISVRASGFPVSISAQLPDGTVQLAPGQSVLVPVQLTWPKSSGGLSLSGGSSSVRGQLALAGQVSSSFTAAISGAFGDKTFRVGGLTGTVSVAASAVQPGQSSILLWLIIALVVLAVAAFLVYRHARLKGRLVLKPPDRQAGYLWLPSRLSVTVPTGKLIQIPGQLKVRNSLTGKNMRVTLRLDGQEGHTDLRPGGHRMIAGVDVFHETAPDVTDSGDRAPRARL